ncbi:unnamed protein product [Mortierella alpina]
MTVGHPFESSVTVLSVPFLDAEENQRVIKVTFLDKDSDEQVLLLVFDPNDEACLHVWEVLKMMGRRAVGQPLTVSGIFTSRPYISILTGEAVNNHELHLTKIGMTPKPDYALPTFSRYHEGKAATPSRSTSATSTSTEVMVLPHDENLHKRPRQEEQTQ